MQVEEVWALEVVVHHRNYDGQGRGTGGGLDAGVVGAVWVAEFVAATAGLKAGKSGGHSWALWEKGCSGVCAPLWM